jgi:hypothetical protein
MEKGKLSLKIEELEDRIAPVYPGFGLVTAMSVGGQNPAPSLDPTPGGVFPGAGKATAPGLL